MGKIAAVISILLWSVAAPIPALPQQQESLGDVARQLRAQKDAEPRKATKIYTNDNLPAPSPNEPVTVLPANPEKPAAPEQAAAKPVTPNSSKQPESTEAGSRTREYWQDKFKAARADLAKAKEHLQLSDDELDLLQIQQVRELDAAAKADLTAKVQDKQSEVNVNKAAAEAAQKALDDLEKEFKDSGAPEEWSQAE